MLGVAEEGSIGQSLEAAIGEARGVAGSCVDPGGAGAGTGRPPPSRQAQGPGWVGQLARVSPRQDPPPPLPLPPPADGCSLRPGQGGSPRPNPERQEVGHPREAQNPPAAVVHPREEGVS